MSHNIIHILRHGSALFKERGMLVCAPSHNDTVGGNTFKHPIEDIRAIVIAARGVNLTSNVMSAVLSNDAIILHCDEKFAPCGITLPITRAINAKIYLNQIKKPVRLNRNIWEKILMQKTINQEAVLKNRGIISPHLKRAVKSKKIDESNCARHYWRKYFVLIGYPRTRRDRLAGSAPNQLLNYGYAVLSSLCHRALIIHGLSPLLGVGHILRYRSNPLVYDMMEPYRPFVDHCLADFFNTEEVPSIKNWAREIGSKLAEKRVPYSSYSIRLINAIDKTAQSFVRCYNNLTIKPLWFPSVKIT